MKVRQLTDLEKGLIPSLECCTCKKQMRPTDHDLFLNEETSQFTCSDCLVETYDVTSKTAQRA